MFRSAWFRLSLAALVFASPPLPAADSAGYRTPSPALAAIVDTPLPPAAVLSPDRRQLLLLDRPEAPTLAELAQPELRLAGLRINPVTNGPSRSTYFTGLAFKPVDGGNDARVTGLPAGVRIADYEWSRDSRHLALTVVAATGIELWLVDCATARARRLTDPILNAALGEPIVWIDHSTLAIRRVPANRGAPPNASGAPAGPVVQENLGQRAAARTYDGLLANAHDEALFEYYATSELALVSLEGGLTPLPLRGLITVVSPSPDNHYVMTQTLHRPYSYLVPTGRFPVTIAVNDRAGAQVFRVADLPLAEGTFNGVRAGPRSVTWRADAPATLSWVQALPAGRTSADKKPLRDAWYTLAAPFSGKPIQQQQFEFRVQSVQWSDDDLALVTETWSTTGISRLWRVAPGQPGNARTLVYQRKTEDRYGDPGRPVLVRDTRGRVVLQRSPDGSKLYFAGDGASPEGDRPFLDEWDPATRQTRRLWRSAPPAYESFGGFIDATLTRALMTRESPTEPTNFFVRSFAPGTLTPLTTFPNPYPQFADVRQELIQYRRADGVALSGTLYLPPGWTPAKGPLPTLLWAYPREFLEEETASQVKATPERFTRVSPTGPLPFLLAGYAVLNDPAMPIVAKKGQKANDSYVQQLVASAQAAVDELVRRGVADPKRIAISGHSYGAFMTANLLAHTRLFRAGIARSGAYNRTLTPFGFQREQRSLWQAPDVYAAMSPFNFAHQVKDPLLLIHGAADNNPGTFPLQSERFYNALKGHGATTRLVMLPHESHGYRARESVLHMLWEMETWLDTHVKNADMKSKAAE
ncbi:alpha/beta hydrolase family protein [Horticoccus sp. 23ND18S-11]|uniref:alpha/beta hydrolase family protein n=1 Tax=Horticoccus sp. 23ND18S-11 TaxID=3391832 RepID=UPI0039C96687